MVHTLRSYWWSILCVLTDGLHWRCTEPLERLWDSSDWCSGDRLEQMSPPDWRWTIPASRPRCLKPETRKAETDMLGKNQELFLLDDQTVLMNSIVLTWWTHCLMDYHFFQHFLEQYIRLFLADEQSMWFMLMWPLKKNQEVFNFAGDRS